jgi:hypothetical protein
MKTLQRIALLAAFVALFAVNADATMTTISRINNLPSNNGGNIKGLWVTMPALAQNDSAQFVFNCQGMYSIQNAGADVWTSSIMWGIANTNTGTDSFTVSVQGGFSGGGPWTSLYAGTLQANTVLGPGTPTQMDNATGSLSDLSAKAVHVIKTDQAVSTLLPFPFMRVQFRLKGSVAITAAEAVRFYVVFPQVTYPGRLGLN